MDNTISEFLRSRRARISPEDAGLPLTLNQRRVPGLRREEIAQLAGVSVDYYTRLEQGRVNNPSDAVFNSVARVLHLSDAEREHLANMLHPEATEPLPEREADPAVFRLVEMMETVPALVIDRRMSVVAYNRLADIIFGLTGHSELNLAKRTFLSPEVNETLSTWSAVAEEVVAHLTLQNGRHPSDERLNELVDELSSSSLFRDLWSRHDVKRRQLLTLTVRLARVGEIEFTNLWLPLPSGSDLTLIAYTVDAGSEGESKLSELVRSLRSSPGDLSRE
ncbi:helix-turn-helix transcriptional regulator [Agreia sp.]|uniref:helix-turn-helix transcriptional regulator n=1 Tax=Agreia sp. TaxID=1872416 RepID=UPI0035BBB525